MLLQEYAPEGSLFEFLTDQQELPNDKILEEMFIQIADAMVFLGKMTIENLFVINCLLAAHNQIVHGDLACRNVLIFRYDQFIPQFWLLFQQLQFMYVLPDKNLQLFLLINNRLSQRVQLRLKFSKTAVQQLIQKNLICTQWVC
jgi:hypothetical protein